MNELIKSLEQEQLKNEVPNFGPCLLYTSDAADD